MIASRLRGPDSATMVGLLTAAGVYLIYNQAVPNLTDVRMSTPHQNDVETERKHAAWKSAALVGVVFLVARDINSFIISGAALTGIDLMYKHANAVHPATGQLDTGTAPASVEDQSSYPLPDYDSGTDENNVAGY